MKTSELLEAARVLCEPPTYYRLAKVLQVSRQAMTKYRQGAGTFDDAVALRVAELLALDAGYVLACMAAERESRPAVRRVWERVAEGLALVLFGVGFAGSPPSAEAGGILHNTFYITPFFLHIMRQGAASWRCRPGCSSCSPGLSFHSCKHGQQSATGPGVASGFPLKEYQMKTLSIAVIVLLLSGCAYQLGGVNTKPGDTLRDTQLDVLMCKDAAMSHGGADAAGWIPFAGFEVEKHIRREEFKNCLLAKGYPSVIPPK